MKGVDNEIYKILSKYPCDPRELNISVPQNIISIENFEGSLEDHNLLRGILFGEVEKDEVYFEIFINEHTLSFKVEVQNSVINMTLLDVPDEHYFWIELSGDRYRSFVFDGEDLRCKINLSDLPEQFGEANIKMLWDVSATKKIQHTKAKSLYRRNIAALVATLILLLSFYVFLYHAQKTVEILVKVEIDGKAIDKKEARAYLDQSLRIEPLQNLIVWSFDGKKFIKFFSQEKIFKLTRITSDKILVLAENEPRIDSSYLESIKKNLIASRGIDPSNVNTSEDIEYHQGILFVGIYKQNKENGIDKIIQIKIFKTRFLPILENDLEGKILKIESGESQFYAIFEYKEGDKPKMLFYSEAPIENYSQKISIDEKNKYIYCFFDRQRLSIDIIQKQLKTQTKQLYNYEQLQIASGDGYSYYVVPVESNE